MKSAFLASIILFTNTLFIMAQVPNLAEDISPLLISENVPSVSITSMNGQMAPLTEIVKEKSSILLFYRGGWCPYCNAHLSAVAEVEKQITELGYKLIAISPDSPEKLNVTMDKDKLNYSLYSDADGSLIKAMGIAFKAPERYSKRLIDYSANQNPGLLPVPSLFIVDTEGIILFEYISPDYKHRISAELLLSILNQLPSVN